MSQQSLSHWKLPTLKQLTNPALSLVLAPISYSLLGLLLAIKSAAIPFGSLIVTVIFLFLVHLQEMVFSKFYRVPNRARSGMLLLSNFLLFLPMIYFAQSYSIRIAVVTIIIVFVNHSYIAHLPSNHVAYGYHVLLNALVKFTLGNVVTYYVITRQLPSSVFQLFIVFAMFGASVIHYKQKSRERHSKEKITYNWYTGFIVILLNLSYLIAYLHVWMLLHNHYTLFDGILIALTLINWGIYQLKFKKALTPGRITTYLYWTLLLLTLVLAFAFHL